MFTEGFLSFYPVFRSQTNPLLSREKLDYRQVHQLFL